MQNSLKIKNRQNMLFYFIYLMNCIILFVPKFENDTYWLIATGKYILSQGFPVHDPFTMHTDLPLVVQQWIPAVIFDCLNDVGPILLYGFCICIYLIITLFIYKFSLLISENNALISFAATLGVQIFLRPFIVLRPQIMSLCVFVLLIYILELYSRTQISRYLMYVPILSVLLINIHAALWFMIFVFMLPFIADGLKIRKLDTNGYGAKKLVITMCISFLAGILNPYGIRNMLYVFYSYGDLLINYNIDEMKSPDFKLTAGIILFILIVILYLIRTRSKESPVLKYTLLSLGTLFMGLSSKRSLCFFYITAIPIIAYYLKNVRIKTKAPNKRLRTITLIILTIVVALNFFIKIHHEDQSRREYSPQQVVNFLKEKYTADQLLIFNGFNIGGFLEYNGFKVYIDSRSELFTKRYNGKKDIFEEYVDVKTGKLHYKDIIEEYGFNCFIVRKEELLDTYLKKDGNFTFNFSDGYFNVYIKN